jgi:hypothetical protein
MKAELGLIENLFGLVAGAFAWSAKKNDTSFTRFLTPTIPLGGT